MKLLIFSCLVAAALALQQEEIIEYINSKQVGWKAGSNFNGKNPQGLKHLMGTFMNRVPVSTDPVPESKVAVSDLPVNFDSRQQWPACPTIGLIRDQSDCGSCWAFGAVESMSDRICIHSNFQKIVNISSEDLLSCCKGLLSCGFGCNGGNPTNAWKYWVNNGIVTGSLYNTTSGCQPYAFPPCAHHVVSPIYPSCGNGTYSTPTCETTCIPQYPTAYAQDKHYGKSHYVIKHDPTKAQQEIFENGPVEAAFNVYEDFITYKSGVYSHQTGTLLGGHAIKILGWGVEGGSPYWLVANSWNDGWGDEGYFKILRGVNECGIEDTIDGGLPAL